MNHSKKGGILLSYLNIILSMLVNVVLTPLLITSLADDTYSLYKVMSSFSGPLIMFNMGVSTIVARSIVQYQTTDVNDKAKKENTLAMANIISLAMAALVMLVGCIMCLTIPSIYGGNYSADLIRVAQTIFVIMVLSVAVHIMTEAFKGCVIGHECFVFNYGTQTIRYLLKFGGIIFVLQAGWGVIAVALVDLLNNLVVFLAYFLYATLRLHERPKLHAFDRQEMREIALFSVAILLQTIVNQVNNNVDIMILGALESQKEIITMYSSALTIYTVYNSMITVFSTVYFPQTAKLVTRGCTATELTDLVIKPGRMQAMIATAIIFGFAFLGKDFITLWIGEKYINAYYVTLMLLIPVTIPLVENVCISIMDAQMKRMVRSVVLVVMAGINVILTLIGVHWIGFWGAALGTVISLLIGHVIIMNVYYQKWMGIQVFRMFRSIFKGTLPVGITTGVACFPLTLIKLSHPLWFVAKGAIFLLIYTVLLWFFSMTKEEKQHLLKNFKK